MANKQGKNNNMQDAEKYQYIVVDAKKTITNIDKTPTGEDILIISWHVINAEGINKRNVIALRKHWNVECTASFDTYQEMCMWFKKEINKISQGKTNFFVVYGQNVLAVSFLKDSIQLAESSIIHMKL